jgi:hypothetical protein
MWQVVLAIISIYFLESSQAFRPGHGPGHGAIAHNNLLEIIMTGLPSRIFPNVSLGLNNNFEEEGRQCNAAKTTVKKQGADGVPRLTFTPNRRNQDQTVSEALQQRLKLAVVLAVGGHSDSHYNYGPGGSINGLMGVWDSWQEYFFSPSSNTSSLVLLFDERDFRRQNITKNKNEYLDTILIKNMGAELVDCAHVRSRHHGSKIHMQHGHSNPTVMLTSSATKVNGTSTSSFLGCSPNLQLDSGYRVYFIDVAASNYSRSYTLKGEKESRTVDYKNQRPIIIFATVHNFPKPSWAEKEDEDELFKNWKPFRLNRRYPTNYGYTKMTNWYSYYMLRLQLLDYFDYAAKLDNDVSFVAPFPMPNLPYQMSKEQHLMMMTTKDFYTDDPRISQGVNPCLQSFVHEEIKYCGLSKNDQEAHAVQIDYNPWTWVNMNEQNNLLRPGGGNDTTFFEKSMNLTFRAHFLVYWLGLYTAPEAIYMAKYWNDWHPRGMWDFRWGDQQWWPRPIAMLGNGNLDKEIWHATELESDNERYVVHKLWPRQGTVPKTQYYDPFTGTTKAERDARYAIAAKPLVYR